MSDNLFSSPLSYYLHCCPPWVDKLPKEALLLTASTHYVLFKLSKSSTSFALPSLTKAAQQIRWEAIYLLYTNEYSQWNKLGCLKTSFELSEVIDKLLKQFKVTTQCQAEEQELEELKQRITEVYTTRPQLAVRHLQRCLEKDVED